MKIFRIIQSSKPSFSLDDENIEKITKDIEYELNKGSTLPDIIPSLAKKYNIPGFTPDQVIFKMIKKRFGDEKLKEIKERSIINYRSGRSRKTLNDTEKEKVLESFRFYIKKGFTIKEIEERQNKSPIAFERFVTENFGPEMYKKLNKGKIKGTSFRNIANKIKENTEYAMPKSTIDIFYFIKMKLDEGYTFKSISELLNLGVSTLLVFIEENFPEHIDWLKNKSKKNRDEHLKAHIKIKPSVESVLGESAKATNSLASKWSALKNIKSDFNIADQIEEMYYTENKTAEEISRELGLNLNAIIEFLHLSK